MDKPKDTDPRAKFRRLPPRVTQDEMVPVQPVVHAVDNAAVGSETEWNLRTGGAG
jgi:hypothetical protein